MTDIVNPLEGKLEPECKPMRDPKDAALFSIAISLKRIADQLCGGQAGEHTLHDMINDISMNTRYIGAGR